LAGVGFDGDDHATERAASPRLRDSRNKGCLIGQKRPLKPKDVWTIRVRLQMERHRRDLAMFNLAIDSKLRGCDLMRLRIDDVFVGGGVRLTGEVEEDMGDSGKDKAAQALGRKGGAARREKLSAERRAEIARNAAAKRWSK
jgi:hypothetical protein